MKDLFPSHQIANVHRFLQKRPETDDSKMAKYNRAYIALYKKMVNTPVQFRHHISPNTLPPNFFYQLIDSPKIRSGSLLFKSLINPHIGEAPTPVFRRVAGQDYSSFYFHGNSSKRVDTYFQDKFDSMERLRDGDIENLAQYHFNQSNYKLAIFLYAMNYGFRIKTEQVKLASDPEWTKLKENRLRQESTVNYYSVQETLQGKKALKNKVLVSLHKQTDQPNGLFFNATKEEKNIE